MSQFSGHQGKGAMQQRRAEKRLAAELRQVAVTHDRTKAHRLARCGCGVSS